MSFKIMYSGKADYHGDRYEPYLYLRYGDGKSIDIQDFIGNIVLGKDIELSATDTEITIKILGDTCI